MGVLDTAKDVVRIASTAVLGKDVIDLLQAKLALLTEQSVALEKENVELKADNKKLRAQLQILQPVAHGLTADDTAILLILETEDRKWKPIEVAGRLRWEAGHTHYLLNKLRDRKFAIEVPTGFGISDKGREALHATSE